MLRRSLSVGLLCLTVLAFLAFPVAAADAAPTAHVPVIVCPTSVGASGPPAPVASSATVPASAAHLFVYSTTNAYLQVLGPRGLACRAAIGADGNATITVFHPYSNGGIAKGGVSAVADPACVSCLLTLACPFFPAAMAALHKDYGTVLRCPSQPLGQVVRRLSAEAVAFSDPAEEYVPARSESLVPSDSPYPTNGVVVYGTYLFRNRYRDSTAMEAVCVLPASEHAVCTDVLNELLATQVRKFM